MFMTASTMGLAASSERMPIFDDPFGHGILFGDRLPRKSSWFANQNTHKSHVMNVPCVGFYNNFSLSNTIKADESPVILLSGYLQSWRFFGNVFNDIRCRFTFLNSIYITAQAALKEKLNIFDTSTLRTHRLIGVHVRRGDILLPSAIAFGHGPASDHYLLTSYDTLAGTYESRTIFIVVSNDMEYCRRLFTGRFNVVFMEGNSAAIDLAILSLMDDLILTVGTFGWWGAFLSDAEIVRYYDRWPIPGSSLEQLYNKSDFFLPHWIPAH
ncbi:galactoside alpha-(1,2)-fucosyltransferase 1-like [Paramacrobiotus metropolitanus]|uniref:galactoside alpha-(1,2)-fucosyltransferase 1-like n=1 Tax=Paramacrobiotus metropolitanus TaxID=2943436 RepID=UPI0024461340|nr:galactoside alpha-(1,2)-fucosyltransferase 1-like [Paramacrobiotus metropolitanus]